MKTATTIYRWTAKTSSRCLGRYYTASTLLEAIKAGKEFVAREFHGTGSILIEASLDGGKTWHVNLSGVIKWPWELKQKEEGDKQ